MEVASGGVSVGGCCECGLGGRVGTVGSCPVRSRDCGCAGVYCLTRSQ